MQRIPARKNRAIVQTKVEGTKTTCSNPSTPPYRWVLKRCLGADHHTVIAKIELMRRELRFDYYTHHYSNFRAEQYVLCYDYGYLPLTDGKCLVVGK
jgi:hypothetical protein